MLLNLSPGDSLAGTRQNGKAARLCTLLTGCSLPQRVSSRSARSKSSFVAGSNNCLLVARVASAVGEAKGWLASKLRDMQRTVHAGTNHPSA
jgi:hypothetical protein